MLVRWFIIKIILKTALDKTTEDGNPARKLVFRITASAVRGALLPLAREYPNVTGPSLSEENQTPIVTPMLRGTDFVRLYVSAELPFLVTRLYQDP